MKDSFLSTFTPSLMSAETLEAIFVQREELVADLIEGIRESVFTQNKHYRLLTGMRGIGKTHTIALIYHRLKEQADLKDKLLIAWLKEEEWGVSSWLDLQIRIFQALQNLEREEDRQKLAQDVEALYELPADEAAIRAEMILKEYIGNRTLLLLTENLDEIFKGLGDKGQKQFRAYLQNHNFITIVATSQSLFNGITSKNSAFYGFFNPQSLDKLSLPEATHLLSKIAEFQSDAKLAKFITSQTGQDRIKAIHHLAGGNHRVYIIFSQFLTCELLDDLVQPVMQTLDELTPYYQARMQWLSPQQRKIINYLCDHSVISSNSANGIATVKDLAKYCFISHQTASSQLKDLLTKGYVIKSTVGREAFYELQEPLMRICLEVKKQRGEPIKLFIDFLRIWYTQEELWERYWTLPQNFKTERLYIRRAMGISLTEEELNVKLFSAIKKRLSNLSQEEINNLLENDNNQDLDDTVWSEIGHLLRDIKKYDEAIKAFNLAIKENHKNVDHWISKAEILLETNQFKECLIAYENILDLTPNDSRAWNNKGVILGKLNQHEKELSAYQKAIDLEPQNIKNIRNKGIALAKLNKYEQAIKVFNIVIGYDSNNYLTWHDKSFALLELNKLDEALESINTAIGIKSDYAPSWIKKGMILHKMQDYDEALNAYRKAIDISNDSLGVLIFFVKEMSEGGKYYEALKYCNYLISIEPESENWRFFKGAFLFKLEKYLPSIESFNKAINLNSKFTDAFTAKAWSLFKVNSWKEGFASIENGLITIEDNKSFCVASTDSFIKIILEDKKDKVAWKNRINTLVQLYDKYQVVSALGKGITENIPDLLSEMISDKAAQTWLEVWQEVGGNKPELEIPLRWLKIAVEYKETQGDRKVLLKLPKEERDLFETLLKEKKLANSD